MDDETKASHQHVLDIQNQSNEKKDGIFDTINPEDPDMANLKVDEEGILDLDDDLMKEFEGKD
jgi:hypothetical protein